MESTTDSNEEQDQLEHVNEKRDVHQQSNEEEEAAEEEEEGAQEDAPYHESDTQHNVDSDGANDFQQQGKHWRILRILWEYCCHLISD